MPTWRSAQTYEECLNLIIFNPLCLFLQTFGQVKELLVLELNEMITKLLAVLCPMVFIFLFDGGRQVAVLKFMKNDHFYPILVVWLLFLKILDISRIWFILELHEMIRVSQLDAWSDAFILLFDLCWKVGVLKLMKNV